MNEQPTVDPRVCPAHGRFPGGCCPLCGWMLSISRSLNENAQPSSKQRPRMRPSISRADYIQELAHYTGVSVPKHIFAPSWELEAILEHLANVGDEFARLQRELAGFKPMTQEELREHARTAVETPPQTSNQRGDSTEIYYAEMEAARNEDEDAYFKARPQLLRSHAEQSIFRAGFEKAFKFLWGGREFARRELDRACQEYRVLHHKYVQDMRRAHNWISAAPHGDNCFVSNAYEGDPGNQCNCGKVVVLEAFDGSTAHETPAAPIATGEALNQNLANMFRRAVWFLQDIAAMSKKMGSETASHALAQLGESKDADEDERAAVKSSECPDCVIRIHEGRRYHEPHCSRGIEPDGREPEKSVETPEREAFPGLHYLKNKL